jgi:precorrin-6Y C5,15-methyltransferase (decarboxylating)
MTEAIGLARRFPKLGILTDPVNNPGRVAEKMLSAGIPDCRAVVVENMGETNEKLIDTRLLNLPGMDFSPLNVLLLIHDTDWKPAPAFSPRPDCAYEHKSGMITKRDVRLMSINRLEICETDVIWDIGAGSGAMSIEMAEIAWRGKVIAVEKERGCLDYLSENVTRFGAINVEGVEGEAPQALQGLPAPNAVFIGGSGGNLVDILMQIQSAALDGCRVAVNFTLLENMVSALAWMNAHDWLPALTEARFSYGSTVGEGTRLAPANPIFILSGCIHKDEGK